MRTNITLVALWLALGQAAFAQEFHYEQFDFPGARLTRPFGVNTSGAIVGLYRDSANVGHGFLRTSDGDYVPIDYPGAVFSNAASINARGDIVGRWTDNAGINHGYLRTSEGEFTSIDPPAPCVPTTQQTVVHGINDIGDLVGRCFDASGKELGWFLRHDGTFRVLDDPSFATTDAWMATNRDEIVGDYSDQAGFVHGYVWSEAGGFVTLDVEGQQTGVRDMNERGDVTGIYSDETGRFHGFLLKDGLFTTIDFPGSSNGGGTLLITNAGVMVGGFVDTAGKEHGFIAR